MAHKKEKVKDVKDSEESRKEQAPGNDRKMQALREELKEEKEKSGKYYAHIQALQADFENYRRFYDKEKRDILDNANVSVIRKLLDVLDDLERAVSSMENDSDRKGVELVYRNFFKILEDMGLKIIESVGKKSDPYYHEVLVKEKSDLEEGTIIEELQKGYLLNSIVIRHSKVKISGGS